MDYIRKIIAKHFPENSITEIYDKGFWLNDEAYRKSKKDRGEDWRGRKIVKFRFDDGTSYCLKLIDQNYPDHFDSGFIAERCFYNLLSETSIPVPEIIVFDDSHEIIGSNYLILSCLDGIKLFDLWSKSSMEEKSDIYRMIGETYSQINRINGVKSGLFKSISNPFETMFPIHPSVFMLRNEIESGSGQLLVDSGILDSKLHNRIIYLWNSNIDVLTNNAPVLVHYSSFCWNISLKFDEKWHVSRLTGCSDTLWWDSSLNLALFKYPPFLEIEKEHWDSFLAGYNRQIDERKINLYGLLIKILTTAGTFYEPEEIRIKSPASQLNAELEQLVEHIG